MSSALKAAVVKAIAHRRPDAAKLFDDSCVIPESADDLDGIEIMNRYWRLQLERVNADTTQAREYLVPASTCRNGHDWLRPFHTGVLPAILFHDLPHKA